MRLYKRKNTYYIDYNDAQGNRHRESTKTGNKKLAEEIYSTRHTEIIEESKMGIKPVRHVLLSDFINDYLAMSNTNKVPKAVAMDKISLRNFKKIVGDVYLDDIYEEHIERYKIERLKEVSSSTVHREMNTIKNMFKIALRRGNIKEDPCKYVKKPQESPERVRYLLKEEELPKLLKEVTKFSYLKLFTIIALNTGMRKSEILGLKWKDVDFENRLIRLEKTKNRKRADILMNDMVLKVFKEYMETIEQEEVKPESRIFPNLDLKRAFSGALKRADITNFHIHDLRHTFASYLVMNNVSLAMVRDLMRHSSFQMTLRYAHLSPIQKQEAVDGVGQVVTDAKSPFIGVSEVLHWAALLKDLKVHEDSHKNQIWSMLSPKAKNELEGYGHSRHIEDSLKKLIIGDFKEIIKVKGFYTPEKFKDLDVGVEANELYNKGPDNLSEEEIQRLNRLVFEAVFPDDIKEAGKSDT